MHAIRMDIIIVVIAATVMATPILTLVDVPTLMPVVALTLIPVVAPTVAAATMIPLVKMMTN